MTKGDKILILFLVMVSVFSFWMIKEANRRVNARYISVQVDGKEIKQLEFSKTKEPYYEVVQTQYGRNKIEVSQDSVRVVEADCPDKLDVLQGSIEQPGHLIVCLPNRLIIEIKGGESTGPLIDDTVR